MSLVGRSRYGRCRRGVSDQSKPSLSSQLNALYTETHRRFLNIINPNTTDPIDISSLSYLVKKFFSDSTGAIGNQTDLTSNEHNRIIFLFSTIFQVNIDCLFEQHLLDINSIYLRFNLQSKVSELTSYISQPVPVLFKIVLFIYILAEAFHVMDANIRDLLYAQLVIIQNKSKNKEFFSTLDCSQYPILDDFTQRNLNKLTACMSQIVHLITI